MKRPISPLFLLLSLLAAACSQPQLTVQAELSEAGAEAADPIADLPIRLVPYDRDAIIDSLTLAGKAPEPRLPVALNATRDSLAIVQAAWRVEEARLRAIQDTMPMLNVRIGADPTERERKLRETQRLEQEQREVKQRMATLQAQISARSREIGETVDSVRAARQRWSQTVLKDFDRIAEARISAAGRSAVIDTTDRAGNAVIRVEEGRWWVYARYALPDTELYWNVPVEVAGPTARVLLNEQNAVHRPLF
jgi:hypothetical protein